MNSLPDLAVYPVFKHLDVADLLACRLVSRRFRFFAEQARLHELMIRDKDLPLQLQRTSKDNDGWWYFAKEPVKKENEVFIWDLSQMQAFPLRIDSLRRLMITLPLRSFETIASFVNQLTKLKHLEIVELEELHQDGTLTIALPELESIYLGEFEFRLTLVCPVLKEVFCDSGFNNIKFVHRESIERLTIEIFYQDELISDTFENVRYFQLNWGETLSRQFLKCLPNVHEIRIRQKFKESLEQYTDAEDHMDYLIEQRAKQGKTQTLRIFYEDVEMVGSKEFGSYQLYLAFGLNYEDVYPDSSQVNPHVCEHCGMIHTDFSDDSLIDSNMEDEDQSSDEDLPGYRNFLES